MWSSRIGKAYHKWDPINIAVGLPVLGQTHYISGVFSFYG